MDVTIDPDIDPAIESQSGIFSKFSINGDFNATHHQHDNHQNAFIEHHQQSTASYASFTIDDQHTQTSDESANTAATTAAAAVAAAENLSNIIDFNQLQTGRVDAEAHAHNSHNDNTNTADSLTFLQNALDLENASTSNDTSGLSSNNSQAPLAKPKQQLIHDSGSQVSIVVVNPGAQDGSSRLGRPRKHTSSNTTNEVSATKNLDESIVSKFRLDARPMGGPGSRGGRKNKNGTTRKQEADKDGKRKIQQQLNFTSKRRNLIVLPVAPKSHPRTKEGRDDDVVIVDEPSVEAEPNVILEDYDSLRAKGRSTARSSGPKVTQKPSKPTETNIQPKLYTNIGLTPLHAKVIPKKRRELIGGPIVGLYNDLYQNPISYDDPELNKIALGYQVKPATYASDIVFILSFFNKFKFFFQDLPNLGPQDIEFGLRLLPSVEYPLDNVNQVKSDGLYEAKAQDPEVSDFMNSFFYKLLTLVLNKRKDVIRSTSTKALYELKEQVLLLGLPSEWRDDSDLFKFLNGNDEIAEEDIHVASSNDEHLYSKPSTFGTTRPLDHTPLDNDGFEENGLEALLPSDRLILLRSLIQWSLSTSDAVKQELAVGVNKQDPTGDKETYYTSRFIKDGDKNVELSNKLAKNLPKKKGKKPEPIAEQDGKPDPYTDASVNPLDSHLSFRLVDFFAGEGGLNGRFYLVRSADSKAGGFGSVSDLKSLSNKSVHDLLSFEQPSRFKLYAQDLTTTLSYSTDSSPSLSDSLDPWYEIASNSEELEAFVEFLTDRLERNKTKYLTNLIDYLNLLLPSLKKFEEIYKDYSPTLTTRQSRRRQITDLREQDRALRKLIDDNERDITEEKEFDEGDYLEDHDDRGNDDNEYYDGDDGDDEDYSG